MKVAVLTHTFPRDNTDTTAAFMKEFCDGLALNNNEVFVITPFDPRFNRRGDRFEIITYKYIWPDSLNMLGYSKTMEADQLLRKRAYFLIPFMVIFGTISLVSVINRNKIDIVNAHWIFPNGFITMIASIVTRVPYVVTIPGTDAYLAYRYKLLSYIAKIIVKRSSGIFSNSLFNLNRILNVGSKPKHKAVISYPVDINKFKPSDEGVGEIRNRHGLKSDDIVLLAVGRMVYKKGYDYLIRAMKPLGDNVKLLLAGEGDLKKTWIELSKRLGLEDKILFIGNIGRDEIVKYYNASDIMVTPSVVDKLGNVDGGPVASFESMACGKPQIVTNILGVADEMKDEVNGLIVPQKNESALSVAINKLAKSKNLREIMGKANRDLIRKEISTQSIGRKYTSLFRQALSI